MDKLDGQRCTFAYVKVADVLAILDAYIGKDRNG